MMAARVRSGTASNCRLMRHAKRRVRTAHGLSPDFYTDTPDCRAHGEGQGKASSPGTWLLVSCSLLSTLRRYAHGAPLSSVDRRRCHHLIAWLLVDDNDQTKHRRVRRMEMVDAVLQIQDNHEGFVDAQDCADTMRVACRVESRADCFLAFLVAKSRC